jgi:hypothetical protein
MGNIRVLPSTVAKKRAFSKMLDNIISDLDKIKIPTAGDIQAHSFLDVILIEARKVIKKRLLSPDIEQYHFYMSFYDMYQFLHLNPNDYDFTTLTCKVHDAKALPIAERLIAEYAKKYDIDAIIETDF